MSTQGRSWRKHYATSQPIFGAAMKFQRLLCSFTRYVMNAVSDVVSQLTVNRGIEILRGHFSGIYIRKLEFLESE